jgi:hypothetical protein
MSAIRFSRGELKGCYMELRGQFGEFSLLGSKTGIGQAFRRNEIRLWALTRRSGGVYQDPLLA